MRNCERMDQEGTRTGLLKNNSNKSNFKKENMSCVDSIPFYHNIESLIAFDYYNKIPETSSLQREKVYCGSHFIHFNS